MSSHPHGGLEDTLLRETVDGPDAGSSRVEEVDALPRGSIIGRYVVLERIGSGGMGVVYAAYDPDLDRRVALKVLRKVVTEEQTESRARSRLLREGQAMAKLRHPNVIAVHDVGTDAGRVFIAMEFIDGSTLTEWLAERNGEEVSLHGKGNGVLRQIVRTHLNTYKEVTDYRDEHADRGGAGITIVSLG